MSKPFVIDGGSVGIVQERNRLKARVKELEAALGDIDMLASTTWADEVSNRRTVGQIARAALKQEQDG